MKFNNETYAKQIRFKSLDDFIDSIVSKKRNAMWVSVTTKNQKGHYINLDKVNNCLDVGTTSDEHYQSSNFFIKMLPRRIEISTFSDQVSSLDTLKGLSYQVFNSYVGDISSKMELTKTFDLVICSATLEHVGSIRNQTIAIQNLIALSHNYLLITVPNRWHPIEFHSRLPLIHWLPENLWRKAFNLIPGLKGLSKESNLNFISASQIISVIDKDSRVKAVSVRKIRLLGLVSNFAILVALDQSSQDFARSP